MISGFVFVHALDISDMVGTKYVNFFASSKGLDKKYLIVT